MLETECSRGEEAAARAAGRQELATGCPRAAQIVLPVEAGIASAISGCLPGRAGLETVRSAVLRPGRVEVAPWLAATEVHPVWAVAVVVVEAAAVAVAEGAGNQQ
jgi:hypothetical protein